jgi:hypothetical protein
MTQQITGVPKGWQIESIIFMDTSHPNEMDNTHHHNYRTNCIVYFEKKPLTKTQGIRVGDVWKVNNCVYKIIKINHNNGVCECQTNDLTSCYRTADWLKTGQLGFNTHTAPLTEDSLDEIVKRASSSITPILPYGMPNYPSTQQAYNLAREVKEKLERHIADHEKQSCNQSYFH